MTIYFTKWIKEKFSGVFCYLPCRWTNLLTNPQQPLTKHPTAFISENQVEMILFFISTESKVHSNNRRSKGLSPVRFVAFVLQRKESLV